MARLRMHPDVVADGQAAPDAAAANRGTPFTRVLLDTNMTGMDGFDLSEASPGDPIWPAS